MKYWKDPILTLGLALSGMISVALLGADSPRSQGTPSNGLHADTAHPAVQPTVHAAPNADALDDKHRIAIGDLLSFRVLEDQEDPQEPVELKTLTVTDSGDMEVPYLGRVTAESKTCRELAREIKTALEKDYYFKATVILAVDQMTKSRGKVYLVGPVHSPGPQEIPSDEVLTLSKAILRAGGFEDYADRRNVKVTRRGNGSEVDKKTFVVDVGEIFAKGKVERDLPLEPGDLILIPERLIRF